MFRGKDAILSGPSGGVVAAARIGERAGEPRIIAFDMGGTSTDVAHYNGAFERVTETRIAGVRLCAPMMDVHTVAAGGGSILRYEDSRMQAGPQSAGAFPGPACYGNGGPLCVSDANLITGRLDPRFFPAVFGADGKQPLNADIAREKFRDLAQKIDPSAAPEDIAAGFRRIAIDNMARAIEKVSVRNGHDITRYTLLGFGGAGGQHVCAIADSLAIQRILLHPLSGLLSAYGIGLADITAHRRQGIETPLNAQGMEALRATLARLEAECIAELEAEGVPLADIATRHEASLRYKGSDTALPILAADEAAMRAAFTAAHERQFGFTDAQREIVLEAAMVEAGGGGAGMREQEQPPSDAPLPPPDAQTRFRRFGWKGGSGWLDAPLYRLERLGIGHAVSGPALLVEDHGMIAVEADWRAEITPLGHVLLTRSFNEGDASFGMPARNDSDKKGVDTAHEGDASFVQRPPRDSAKRVGGRVKNMGGVGGLPPHEKHLPKARRESTGGVGGLPPHEKPSLHAGCGGRGGSHPPTRPHAPHMQKPSTNERRVVGGTPPAKVDPVMLEIFNNLFMSVAERMGIALEKTSVSVNIRERLDFSCALFDDAGRLIANAPHIPVHLGSMGASVQEIIRRNPTMQDGDVFALNDPYHGGTHLPDVTTIMPVFLSPAAGEPPRPLFYTAARGHHADIGGITPGSMPPFSTRIEEEGVLLDNAHIVSHGVLREDEILRRLAAAAWPARNPAANLADLKAQIAACRKGAEELRHNVCAQFGVATTRAYMAHVRDNAEESIRSIIASLDDCERAVRMDSGEEIRVRLRIDKQSRTAEIDFTGSSPQTDSNVNAPSSIVTAAVLYVFRCLACRDIPLNDGCLRPLKITIPSDCFLAPKHPAAVVAGNVETSQHLVDCLFGALGAVAASQGTMNNLAFGDADHQYYETICGGAGAGPTFPGASAVQTHMTNSRLTDAEILEQNYPVTLERFALRAGSGGRGAYPGGDGVIRVLRFERPMTVSILSNRRRHRPFGLAGGGDGAPGENLLRRANGAVEMLEGADMREVLPGDRIEIRTPGGGGYAPPTRDES